MFAFQNGRHNVDGDPVDWEALDALTYSSNFFIGILFLLLAAYPLVVLGRRHEPRSGWLRGAMCITAMFVMLIWIPGMGEEFDTHHGVMPLLVLADWVFVGRNQGRTRWWEPFTWPAFLVLYLFYYKANDLQNYPDILNDGNENAFVPIGLGVCFVMGFLFWGIAKLRVMLVDSVTGKPEAADQRPPFPPSGGYGPPPAGYPPPPGPSPQQAFPPPADQAPYPPPVGQQPGQPIPPRY